MNNLGPISIYSETSNIDFINSFITENEGGLHFYIDNHSKLINCTCNKNNGDTFVYCHTNNQLTILNSIIWNNSNKEIQIINPNNMVYIANTNIKNGRSSIYGDSIQLVGKLFDLNPAFLDTDQFNLSNYSECIGIGLDSINVKGTWIFSPKDDFYSIDRPQPVNSKPDIGASENVLFEHLAGIKDSKFDINKIHVYPNPADETIYITNIENEELLSIRLLNLKGEIIQEMGDQIRSSTLTFNIVNIPPGLYLIEIETKKEKIIMKLAIK